MAKTGPVLFVLMFATIAHAQVYKCTDDAGNLVFSDKPCAVDAEIVEGVEAGSNGIGTASAGPGSSITLANGSILPYKKIISIEVRTEMGYRTGREGMYIPYDGTDHLVEFENLVSLNVMTWSRESCGNYSHLCLPMVRIRTVEREVTVRYEALRNIKVLVDDELDGVEKEMTIWFANYNKPHIKSIRFQAVAPD
jgi:hypothetical protein